MRGSYNLQNISILCPAETLKLQGKMATLRCSARNQHIIEWRYSATHSLPEHYVQLSGQLQGSAAFTLFKDSPMSV